MTWSAAIHGLDRVSPLSPAYCRDTTLDRDELTMTKVIHCPKGIAA